MTLQGVSGDCIKTSDKTGDSIRKGCLGDRFFGAVFTRPFRESRDCAWDDIVLSFYVQQRGVAESVFEFGHGFSGRFEREPVSGTSEYGQIA